MKNILISLTIILSVLLVGCHESSSIGIIGGADGPTAILVTTDFNWWRIAGIIIAIAVVIVGVVLLFKKKK